MRSQLVVLSIIAAAISGCGKDVSREASLNAQANSLSFSGCGDRIGRPAYQQVNNLTEISRDKGSYELVSFDAVATQLDASSRQVGVSVVSGTKVDNSIGYNQVCSDLSQMPNGSMTWSVSTPDSISAETGDVDAETKFDQTIYGAQVRDEAGLPRAQADGINSGSATSCKDMDDMMRGQNCVAAEFFKIDENTIGVLRTVQTNPGTGETVVSKIFAQYKLVGADPTDTPTDGTPNTDGKKGKGKGKGQGKDGKNNGKANEKGGKGGQGSGGQGTKGNSNANNSNNSNNSNNANNANNSANGKANDKSNGKANDKANNANNANNSANDKANEKGGQGSGGQGSGGQGTVGKGGSTSNSNVTYIYPFNSLEDLYGPAITDESDDSDDDSHSHHRHSRDSDETILKKKEKSKHKSKVTGSGVVKSKDKEKSKLVTLNDDGTITETKTKVKVKKKKAPRN